MRYVAGVIEIVLLIAMMASGWIRIEADRDNPPEPLPQRDVSELRREAEKFFDDGQIAQTSRLYWHIIKLDPRQVEARFQLASIYQSSIHSWENDALKLVNDALAYAPEYVDAHLLKGKILRNQGGPREAAREYLQVLAFDPENAEAHYHLGTAYEGNQQYDDATYHYQQAISGDPTLEQPIFEAVPFGLRARLQLARLLYRQKQPDKAIDMLEETLALAPDYGEAKSELALLLRKRAERLIRESADPDVQLANYQRILEIDPEDPLVWHRMGQIYEHYLDQPDKAMKAYKRAYELDPFYGDALLDIRSLELKLKHGTTTEESL